MIVIHLGGNDIGNVNRSRLLERMKRDFKEIIGLFPSSKVVFSDIIGRQSWRPLRAKSSAYVLEMARRFLNMAMSGFTSDIGMGCIRHSNICRGVHLVRDGVHLNIEGQQLFLLNIRLALIRRLW